MYAIRSYYAQLTAYPSPEEAYLAGLLHRLGQLALLQAHPDEYQGILAEGMLGEALNRLESEKLGYTSPAIAAQLIDSWELQSFISDAVLYQNEPRNNFV